MLPKERNLEESIENHLVSMGYEQGHSQEFDLQYCLFSDDLFRFLEATQKELIDELNQIEVQAGKRPF